MGQADGQTDGRTDGHPTVTEILLRTLRQQFISSFANTQSIFVARVWVEAPVPSLGTPLADTPVAESISRYVSHSRCGACQHPLPLPPS